MSKLKSWLCKITLWAHVKASCPLINNSMSQNSSRRRVPYNLIPEDQTSQAEKTKKTWRVVFFLLFFELIAGAVYRNINITIVIYVSAHAQQFKRMFFLKGWIFSKVKITGRQFTKFGRNKAVGSTSHTAMFVLIFPNF